MTATKEPKWPQRSGLSRLVIIVISASLCISFCSTLISANAIDLTTISAAGNYSSNMTQNSSHDSSCSDQPHRKDWRFPVAVYDFEAVKVPLVGAAWLIFVSLAKIGFQALPRLSRLFPESCVLIVVGVIVGVILYFTENRSEMEQDVHQLDTDIFFHVLLPPIIIEAGYFMPTRLFFDQLGTIVMHAVLGTLLNAAFIGFSLWGVGLAGGFGDSVCLPFLHAMVFASLLAAVDPVAVLAIFEAVHVNEVLYIVIFGESLLNDGISVVLYNLFKGLGEIGAENVLAVDIICGILSFFVVVIGAVGIGVVFGIIGALLSRFSYRIRTMEPFIVIIVCYIAFMFAEMFRLSGILACTFCGITMNKYVEANISHKSRITIRYTMKIMATVAESIVFMYLGIAAVSDYRVWNTSFILLTLIFCLIYRAIVVVILTFLVNRVRLIKMSYIDQFIMSYGGLRGAIAFALVSILEAEKMTSSELFVTTTIVVIYFTNLILGGTMKPLVKFLKVKIQTQEETTMNEAVSSRVLDYVMIGIEAITSAKGHNVLRSRFSKFNNRYLKTLLIRRDSRFHRSGGHGSQILSVFRQLNVNDALQLAQPPNTAHSLSRWNNSLRNITLISRSTAPGDGLPWNNSSANFGAQQSTDQTITYDSSEQNRIPNGVGRPNGWTSIDDSSDNRPNAASPMPPKHWIPRRTLPVNRPDDSSTASNGINYCSPYYAQSSSSDLSPFRYGGSRNSLTHLLPADTPSPGSSGRRRVRFDQSSYDDTHSESLPDGFNVVEEIVPRREPEVRAAGGHRSIIKDRHLTLRKPTNLIWSLSESTI